MVKKRNNENTNSSINKSKFYDDDYVVKTYGEKALYQKKAKDFIDDFNEERKKYLEKAKKEEYDDEQIKQGLASLDSKFFEKAKSLKQKDTNDFHNKFFNSLVNDTKQVAKQSALALTSPISMMLDPINDLLGIDIINDLASGAKTVIGKIKGVKKTRPTTNDVLKSCAEGLGFVYLGNLMNKSIGEDENISVEDMMGDVPQAMDGIMKKMLGKGGLMVGLAWIAADAIASYSMAKDWDVSPTSAILGGGISGTDSGIGNAVKNATKWGMTLSVFGPFGMVIGGVIGGVLGYIGGERVSQFIDFVINIGETILDGDIERAKELTDEYLEKGHSRAVKNLSKNKQKVVETAKSLDTRYSQMAKYDITDNALVKAGSAIARLIVDEEDTVGLGRNLSWYYGMQDIRDDKISGMYDVATKQYINFDEEGKASIKNLSDAEFEELQETFIKEIQDNGHKNKIKFSTLLSKSIINDLFLKELFTESGWDTPLEMLKQELAIIGILRPYMQEADINQIFNGFTPIDKFIWYNTLYNFVAERNTTKKGYGLIFDENKGMWVNKDGNPSTKTTIYEKLFSSNVAFNLLETYKDNLYKQIEFYIKNGKENIVKNYIFAESDKLNPLYPQLINDEEIYLTHRHDVKESRFNDYTDLNDAFINNPYMVIDKQGNKYKLHKDDIIVAMKDVDSSLQGLYEEWGKDIIDGEYVLHFSEEEKNLDELIEVCQNWLDKPTENYQLPHGVSIELSAS